MSLITLMSHLLGAVDEGVRNIPACAVRDDKAPGQGRTVQVGEQTNGEVTEEYVLVVEAGARTSEVSAQPGQQEREVPEARDGGHKGRRGIRRQIRVGDVQWHLQIP